MEDIRLNKYISLSLGVTRTESKKIIKSKKIQVNGNTINDSNYKIKDNDEVTYNGNIICFEEKIYLMMNKPKGYVCSTIDDKNKTVLELINNYNTNKLLIVGRLDIDTTGLLLITNDGDFVHKVTSPNKSITKKYFVKCDQEFTTDDVRKFNDGVEIYLDQNTIYKCKSSTLEILDDNTEAYITISEGKYHQVKKMCATVGKKVQELKRVQIGLLKLDEKLSEGSYRKLTSDELETLLWLFIFTVSVVEKPLKEI